MSDRKYRQSGYKDEREAGTGTRRGEAQPRQREREGPRGRGLGAPTKSVLRCSRCGAPVSAVPSPEDVCRSCESDLHTCTNCRHFDSAAPKECRKPVEVRVAVKAKKNDCGLFEPKQVMEFASDAARGGTKGARDAKAAFDDLFDF